MNSLNKNDYITVLQYYDISYQDLTLFEMASKAEDILANKLCRCIKKVEKETKNKKKAIAVCTNSVLKQRNLKVYKYKCDKKIQFIPHKKTRKKLYKTAKHIKMGTRRYLSR